MDRQWAGNGPVMVGLLGVFIGSTALERAV